MDKSYEPGRNPDTGVPYCAEDECKQYDGKRCRLLGFRPESLCEPAVVDLVAEVRLLRLGLERAK